MQVREYTLSHLKPGHWQCFCPTDKLKVCGFGKDANAAIKDYKKQQRRQQQQLPGWSVGTDDCTFR